MKHRHVIDIHPATSAGYSLIDDQLATEHAMRYHLTVVNEVGKDIGWPRTLIKSATLKPFGGFRVLFHASFDTPRFIACLNRKSLTFNLVLPYGLRCEIITVGANQSYDLLLDPAEKNNNRMIVGDIRDFC